MDQARYFVFEKHLRESKESLGNIEKLLKEIRDLLKAQQDKEKLSVYPSFEVFTHNENGVLITRDEVNKIFGEL